VDSHDPLLVVERPKTKKAQAKINKKGKNKSDTHTHTHAHTHCLQDDETYQTLKELPITVL
jgi:hypothetical protein